MKIIHSFWSKPIRIKDISDGIYRDKAGWFNKQYFYMSWALSCLKFRDIYGNIELVTDDYGKELCDVLELPYYKVTTDLNDIEHYSHHLWAIGKLYTYSLQKEPFLHVDSDVFVWKRFSDKLLKSDIIAQNIEVINHASNEYYLELEQYLEYVPECIRTFRKEKENIIMANFGIFGGNNIDFIREYVDIAFDFVNKNLNGLEKLPKRKGWFNMIFEQYLFYCLTVERNKTIATLFEHESFMFNGLLDFFKVPNDITYTHVLGSYKKFETICNDVSNRLLYEYPSCHKRINQLISMNIL